MLKVLLVASECVPFSKTGGLADVVGALPKELVRQGVDARVITPLYSSIPEHLRSRMEHVLFFYVNMGWRRQYVGIEKLNLEGVTYYFIDNEYYFIAATSMGRDERRLPTSAGLCWKLPRRLYARCAT